MRRLRENITDWGALFLAALAGPISRMAQLVLGKRRLERRAGRRGGDRND